MDANDGKADALYLLQWHRDLGADCAVGGTPIDWLTRGPTPPGKDFTLDPGLSPAGRVARPSTTESARHPAGGPPRGPQSQPTAPQSARSPKTSVVQRQGQERSAPSRRPQTPLAAREAENEGRAAAASASTLDDLETALKVFDGCSLRATATNLCFYRGSKSARLMIIGEAPGRDEDLNGKPFVGRAGQLLDKMLASIGIDETNVHITNIVYWRPPGNRTPTPQETLACRPFLDRQIELVDPDVIVALGGSAAKELFQVSEGIMRLRGKWREMTLGSKSRAALATLHPAYLLRTPAAKQLVWRDLLTIKSKIGNAAESPH